jgi:hypothetical protein
MGLFDGIKKIVGVVDPAEALANDNERLIAVCNANTSLISSFNFLFHIIYYLFV